MKSILIGYVIGDNKSGIDTYVLNISKILREAGYLVDFLTNQKTAFMESICQERGIGLIEIPTLKNAPQQYKVMMDILKQKHYDIAYFNISEAFNSIGLLASKKAGIPKIIVHSHSSSVGGSSKVGKVIRKVLHVLFKKLVIRKTATTYLACSQLAAEWMFDSAILKKKDYKIVNNAVEAERFQYNPMIREKKRKELKLENKFIIGHVSGFTPTKNVSFLIDIMQALQEAEKDAHLVLVGEGDETEKVKQKIKDCGLEAKVTMLGRRTDVAELLQAFDAFLLPSIFEGAPIVAIEAQVAGMMVYLSDAITKEVKLSEKCQFISLEKSPKEWAEIVLAKKQYDRAHTDFSKAEYCFDIEEQKKELLELL